MIKIAVCDDDRTVRESIVKALRRYERENEMEFEVLEYAAADTMLISYPADLDLILLDIYMPGIDGMDAAKAIRQFDQDVCIIFITTMYQRAIEGYKVRAFGFIRKPVSYEEFSHEIGDAVKNTERSRQKEHYISIKTSGKSYRVPVTVRCADTILTCALTARSESTGARSVTWRMNSGDMASSGVTQAFWYR